MSTDHDSVKHIFVSGALVALIGVAAGAFGAHGLRPILSDRMMAAFETGVRYHLVHAVGMLVSGLSYSILSLKYFRWAAWSFFIGILLFSGSLYALSITNIPPLGILTPFGGVAFMIGWGILAWGYSKAFSSGNSQS